MLVIDVLVTASAASTEVRAFRKLAMGRRLEHFDQFAFGELLFLAHDFRRDALAIDRERNEDSLAVISRDAFSAESDVFDF